MNSYPQKPVVPRPKNVSQGGSSANRLLGVLLLLVCAVGFSLKATAADWTRQNDGNATITAESCLPANNFIDPGETNTVSFVLKNTSGGDRTEVKVNILEQDGVTFRSGEVNVGSVAKDATFTVSFSFRANGSCGGTLTPTLQIASKDRTTETVAFNGFQLGATVKTTYGGANTAAIVINDYNTDSAKLGRANPYPSSITVSGVPKADTGETVDKVTVTLNNISHGYSQDIQALLVSPNGKKIPLMGDAGGSVSGTTAPITDVTLTFDQSAGGQIPQNAGQITSGTYKPSDYNATAYPFPDAGAGSDTLSSLNGMSDPNGAWKLYVVDASTGDLGTVAGGWSLSIRTTKIVCCSAGQLFPFVTRIGEATVNEDLIGDGGKDKTIASFTAWDLDETDPTKLTIVATSSDQTKVTDSNLVIEGSGIVDVNGIKTVNRTVKVKSLVANASGSATITVSATDPQGHVSTSSFNLKINPKNDEPTVTQILGQKVNVGTATGPLAFTVGDVETLAENLIVIPETSASEVVPVQNIVVTGSGANRFVNVFPATASVNQAVTITLKVRDAGQPGDSSATYLEKPMSFIVDFSATAGKPTITPYVYNNVPTSFPIDEDGSVVIPFQVRSGSESISPDSLSVTRTVTYDADGNTSLLPLANAVIGGSGINRTLTVTPAANQNGVAYVNLVVSNGSQQDSTTVKIVVNPVNDAPTITSVGSQITNEDTTSGDIVFTVGDRETLAADLIVDITSDNTDLVPAIKNPTDLAAQGGYSIAVNGATRTLKIRPAPNAFGKATVTVKVKDTGDPVGSTAESPEAKRPKESTTTFVLTVNAVNDQPRIGGVKNELPANADTTVQVWNGDVNPTIVFKEDSGSTADDSKGIRTIILTDVTPGPISPAIASEASQSVSISASSSKPEVVSVVKTELKDGVWRLYVKLGENKYTASDALAEITLTLQDNGGTALGGNDTAVKKFKINVTPVNDQPSLVLPTLVSGAINIPKNRSYTVPMTLSDVETLRQAMDMSVTVEGDTAKIWTDANGSANANILFDLNRTLITFIPNPLGSTQLPYTVTVTVTATDKGATGNETSTSSEDTKPQSKSVTFQLGILNIEPPTISSSASELTVDEDNVASATLTVGDNKSVSTLTYTVKSDNEALVPKENVLFGPLSASNTRSLAIVPQPDQNGVANITIIVKDDENLEAQTSIKVTVRPVNDPPKITLVGLIAPTYSDLGVVTWKTIDVNEDKETADESTGTTNKELSFDVSDAANETTADKLVVKGTSNKQSLVPDANIIVEGTGTRRTVRITPAAGKNGGPAAITLTVTDETGLSSSAQFNLNVKSVNDAPTINTVSTITVSESTNPQATTVNLTGIGAGSGDPGDVATTQADATDGTLKEVKVDWWVKGSDPKVKSDLIASYTTTPLTVTDGKASFQFTPGASKNGWATFAVTVTDNGGTDRDGKNSTTMTFDVEIKRVNANPTISWDATTATASIDRSIDVNGDTGVIPIYVGDAETDPVYLTLTGTSLNPTVVPNTALNIQTGGAGTTRSVRVLPAPGQFGTAAIVMTVTDKDGGTKSATLNLTVKAGQAPQVTITPSTTQIGVNQFTDLIQVNLFDAQTPNTFKFGYDEADLVQTDNPLLVPASSSNIQFGGSGANRVMIILPRADQTGTAKITLYAKDGDGNKSAAAVFTLKVVGAAPTISAPTPSAVTADIGKQSAPVTVTVADKETFPGLLAVTGKSSDQLIVSDNNIFALGNGSSRTVTVIGGLKAGTATITLTVTDAEGQTAATSFTVTVADNNTAPTITSIPAQSTTKNKPTGVISFVVGDKESAAGTLTVTATSANTTLVPNTSANLLLVTSPSNPASRGLVITPAADQTGTALITVKVTDEGGKSAETSFALTVSSVQVANDFNGDGTQDIILQDNGGYVAAWFMSGDDVLSTSFLTPNNVGDLGWKAVGSADFDGDGKPDLLFQHTDGSLAVWKLNGVTMASASLLTPANAGQGWIAVAVGDFNKDGKPDALFQHTDGTLAVWFLDGLNLASVSTLNPSNAGPGWTVVGTGDVNGDTNLDIVFQHEDGTLAVWYLTGNTNLLLPSLLTPQNPGDANWRGVGTIDLNGDGKVDILFQNRADNSIAVWYMNRATLILGKLLNPSNPGGTWRVVAP